MPTKHKGISFKQTFQDPLRLSSSYPVWIKPSPSSSFSHSLKHKSACILAAPLQLPGDEEFLHTTTPGCWRRLHYVLDVHSLSKLSKTIAVVSLFTCTPTHRLTPPRGHPTRGWFGHCLAVGDVKRRQIAPTLLISAGAIVLLTCSTAFETPGRNKQIRHWSTHRLCRD